MLHSDASIDHNSPLNTPTTPLANAYPRVETRRHATVLAISLGGGVVISLLGLYHSPGLGWTLATWLASATWVMLSRVQKRSLVREENKSSLSSSFSPLSSRCDHRHGYWPETFSSSEPFLSTAAHRSCENRFTNL
ncbi:MAG: hypothetical protein GY822_13030 [Deltaproteobacteria bacterium]|nr:hypothetical protein [Deltaproteobacteria bacterium]